MIDCEIKSLPINIMQIVHKMGIAVYSYKRGKELIEFWELDEVKKINSAFTVYVEEKCYIFFNDVLSRELIKFVLAHELGHYLLGHEFKIKEREEKAQQKSELKLKKKKKDTLETEADMFALRLLAPSCVLGELGIVNAPEIESLCKIPHVQAVKKAKRMRLLFSKNHFCRELRKKETEEKKVFEQFKNFIDLHKQYII